MNEELHRYVLRSPRLLDSPPDVCLDTSPSDVSWRDDDLELSHFSGDRYKYRRPSISSNNSQTKGGHLHLLKKMASCDFYSFIIIFYLFARFI